MNHSSKDGNEVFYMDDVTDDSSRPLAPPEELPIIEPRIHASLSAMSNAQPTSGPKSDRRNMDNETRITPDALSNDIELKEEANFPEENLDPENGMRERSNTGAFDSKLNIPTDGDETRSPGRRYSVSTRSRVQGRPDVNVYQQKKTLAQGMMDLALLSANANQFRYVLQTDGNHPYFYPSLVMIGTSLFLQVAVGIGLIWNSRYNIKDYPQMCKANKANNWTVIGVFLVTILNVFISSFGVVDQVPAAPLTT